METGEVMKGGGAPRGLRILFSQKDDWEPLLRARLPGCEIVFAPFRQDAIDADAHDIVVPLRLDAARWLNSPEGRNLRAKALVPPDPVMARCDDKLAFADFLIEKGLGANVPSVIGPFDHPYILKRRIDEWGQNTLVIKDAAMAEAHHDKIASPDYFTQEFIAGQSEFATHLLVDGSHVAYCGTVEMQFVSDQFVFGKQDRPRRRLLADHRHHLRLFAEIVVRLGYEGLCCFDYKVQDGVVKIFELNPRFGGSLAFKPMGALKAYAQAVAKRAQG